MRIINISNFTPFPGNYFSYVFPERIEFKKGETLCLRLSDDEKIGVEVKVIQKVKLEEEIKVQFHALKAVKIQANAELEANPLSCGETPVAEREKDEFKHLLQKWDSDEFSDPKNHYFAMINETSDRKRFVELIGGCLNRPNKYPFLHQSQNAASLEARVEVMRLTDCDEQLEKMKQILASEIIR